MITMQELEREVDRKTEQLDGDVKVALEGVTEIRKTTDRIEDRVKHLGTKVDIMSYHQSSQRSDISDIEDQMVAIRKIFDVQSDRLDRQAAVLNDQGAMLAAHVERLDTQSVTLESHGVMLTSQGERLDKIETRLDSMDGRLDTMDGKLERMDGRLDTMDGKLERILDAVGAGPSTAS
jgi:chromosome segregation ATPase